MLAHPVRQFPRLALRPRLLAFTAAIAVFAVLALGTARTPTAAAQGLYFPYVYPYSYVTPSWSPYTYWSPYVYSYAWPSSYGLCGANPLYYSYPSSFTCPISPLYTRFAYPWWSYRFIIP
jgi:hypothetical protein